MNTSLEDYQSIKGKEPVFWFRVICPLSIEGMLMTLFLYSKNRTDVDLFFIYMNKCHPNIKFTMELEINNTVPYLDILITRHSNGKLTTKVYRKPTYTGLYLRWDSFVPKQYKKGLVKCLLNRTWHICSSVENFDQEVDFIRSILAKNGYPLNFIDTITKNFIQSKLH